MVDFLSQKGFTKLAPWARGVDTALFNPDKKQAPEDVYAGLAFGLVIIEAMASGLPVAAMAAGAQGHAASGEPLSQPQETYSPDISVFARETVS